MTGHDPDSPVPTTAPTETLASPATDADRTIEASPPDAAHPPHHPAVTGQRFGGGVSLIVAFMGLVGAALGAGWLGLESRYELGPGGFWGGVLTLIAAALAVLGLLMVVGALGYYVMAPAFGPRPAAWRGVGSHRLVIATTMLVVLLANTGPVAYVALTGPEGLLTLPGFLLAASSVGVALLGITYLRFIRPGVMTARDLGLDWGRLPRLVGIGLGLGISVLIISALIQAAIQAAGFRQTQMVSLQHIRDFPLLGFLAVVFAGGVLAPIAEELFFRGYVFRTYLQTKGPWVAYGVTSLLFATLHLNLPALLPILVLSVLFCYAYHKTGSIIPSIVGHAVNNTAAFCVLYFTNAPL